MGLFKNYHFHIEYGLFAANRTVFFKCVHFNRIDKERAGIHDNRYISQQSTILTSFCWRRLTIDLKANAVANTWKTINTDNVAFKQAQYLIEYFFFFISVSNHLIKLILLLLLLPKVFKEYQDFQCSGILTAWLSSFSS